jgi:hypothetical protein
MGGGLISYGPNTTDPYRRWRAKRDRTIQMFYVQGDGSLSELAGAAGITKQRAQQKCGLLTGK